MKALFEGEPNMTTTKKKMKWWQVVCIVLASIFAFICLVLLGARGYFRLSVASYYGNSEKAFIIPDSNSGFVAQGLCFDEKSGKFIASGYTTDGSASPLYVISNTKKSDYKKVTLYYEDGTPYTKHSGGVSVHGDYIYVVGGDEPHLYVFSYQDVMNAENNGKVKCIGVFDSPIGTNDEQRISFTTATKDGIYAGKFYRAGNYESPESYVIKTKDGENRAIVSFYPFDEKAPFGIATQPTEVYSVPDQVQGMAVQNDTLYLSTSYGVAFSHILAYKKPTQSGTFGNTSLPLYILDSSCLIKDNKIPPMSEEIEILNGKMYTMCESASNKYIFGKLTSSQWCYATELDWLVK